MKYGPNKYPRKKKRGISGKVLDWLPPSSRVFLYSTSQTTLPLHLIPHRPHSPLSFALKAKLLRERHVTASQTESCSDNLLCLCSEGTGIEDQRKLTTTAVEIYDGEDRNYPEYLLNKIKVAQFQLLTNKW